MASRVPVLCRIAHTAASLNDLAFLAGLHPDLTFVDLTMEFKAAQETPSLLPPCLSAIVVTPASPSKETVDHGGTPDSTDKGSSNAGARLRNTRDSQAVWFQQSIEHIPEVYALLHAVLNCPVQAFVAGSIFARLDKELALSTPTSRQALVQHATDLQNAYIRAIAKGTWRLPTTTPPAEPYRYTTFAQPEDKSALSSTTRDVFEIDRSGTSWVDAVVDYDCSPYDQTILTDLVRDRIRTIVDVQAADGEYAVVGLVWRPS